MDQSSNDTQRKKRAVLPVIFIILNSLLFGIAVLAFFGIRWMFQTWPNLSMQELVYHLSTNLDGTSKDMLIEGIVKIGGPVLLALVFMVLFLTYAYRKNLKKQESHGNQENQRGQKNFVIASFALSFVASVVILAGSLWKAWDTLEVATYIDDQTTESTFIEEHYIDPDDTEITFPDKKRNLIFIYLESTETTFSDKENGGAFDNDFIPELTEIAQENEDFSGKSKKLDGGTSLQGTTWTIGAMFGQTSGLPLNIPIALNNMDTQEHFFEKVTTLGDILQNNGYKNYLMLGSDTTFGGRELYFKEHGDYAIHDYDYAVEKGKYDDDDYVWWGYDDNHLIDFAKEELTEIAAKDQPFNYTMLTVDTHFEDGYVCESCPDEYDDQYANVIRCSSERISEFVKWIQEQSWYDNTTIILSGDHPTMDTDFCNLIDAEYQRKTYTAYINAKAETEATDQYREYSTFDDFPTTLAALGCEIKGNRLGLGTNLFSDEQTLTEVFGNEKLESELSKKSAFLDQLSDIDTDNEELKEREGQDVASADTSLEYAEDNTAFSVLVDNVKMPENLPTKGKLALWTKDDKSDIFYVDMYMHTTKRHWKADVYLSDLTETEYKFEPILIIRSGKEYPLGEGSTNIKTHESTTPEKMEIEE